MAHIRAATEWPFDTSGHAIAGIVLNYDYLHFGARALVMLKINYIHVMKYIYK